MKKVQGNAGWSAKLPEKPKKKCKQVLWIKLVIYRLESQRVEHKQKYGKKSWYLSVELYLLVLQMSGGP